MRNLMTGTSESTRIHFTNARLGLLIALASVFACGHALAQTTRTWDGGNAFAPLNLSSNENWSGDIRPGVTNDTAQWNGTVAGPLALLYTDGNSYTGVAGNVGLNIQLTGGQTDTLNLDVTTNAGFRVKGDDLVRA